MECLYTKKYERQARNLYETLVHSAYRFPGEIAVVDDEESITYGELLEKTDRLAAFMKDICGLKSGGQIGFFMVNSIRFAASFYAAAKIGCLAVMINTKYQQTEIAEVLSDTEVEVLLCDARWFGKILPVLRSSTAKKVISEKRIEEGYSGFQTWSFDDAYNYRENEHEVSTVTSDYPVVLMYTSGTTGKPKGIMVSHGNILENAYDYEEVQQLGNHEVSVLSVPLIHILGLSCVLTYFVYLGGTVVLSAFYKPEDILEKIERYHATHFHSVPTVFIQLLNANKSKICDLSTLKTVICGGAPIGQKYIDKVCRMMPNATFRLAYGMTETAGAGALSYTHKGKLKAMPNVGIMVTDEAGQFVEGEMDGEIIFYGPVVADRIWKQKNPLCDRVYSGDLGKLDADGTLTIIGRKKGHY